MNIQNVMTRPNIGKKRAVEVNIPLGYEQNLDV